MIASIFLAAFFPTGAMPPMPTPTAITLLLPSASPNPEWHAPAPSRITWQGPDGYINVPLPINLNPYAAQSLTALRLWDEQHHEVPYVLDPIGSPPVPISDTATRTELPKETVFTFDLVHPGTEISEIRFRGATQEFFRNLNIEASADGQNWLSAQAGVISHYGHAASEQVVVCHTLARFLRITIFNKDDTPIAQLTPVLAVPEHHIVFLGDHTHQYTADWNSQAGAPQYDIGIRFNTANNHTVANGQLLLVTAPEEWWAPLWQNIVKLGIGLGVLVMAYICWRMFRHR